MKIESVGNQDFNHTRGQGAIPVTNKPAYLKLAEIEFQPAAAKQDTFVWQDTSSSNRQLSTPSFFTRVSNKFGEIKDMVKSDDFSGKEFAKNLGKGMVEPFKFLVQSPKNMAIGAGLIAAGTAIIHLGGGPIIVALDVLYALANMTNFASSVAKAKTSKDLETSGSDLGKAMLGLYGMAGSKIALKNAGVEHTGGRLSAAFKSFAYIPKSIKNIGHNIVEGYFKGIGRMLGLKSPATQAEKSKTFVNTLPNPFTVGSTVTNAITSSGIYEGVSSYIKRQGIQAQRSK